MLKRVVAIQAVAVLVALGLFSASAAFADGGNGCQFDPTTGNQVCGVGTGTGGSSGGGSQGGGGYSPVGFTPGPTTCKYDGGFGGKPTAVPCSTGDDWWSTTGDCYNKLFEPQSPPPPGQSASVGAWYVCAPYVADPAYCSVPANMLGPGCVGVTFWSNTPPPGINRYTPAQAAAALAKTFVLTPITIGMAPADKVHTDDPVGTVAYRRTWVGIPVWLWVGSPSPTSWGPYSKTATLGGVTVTATAVVSGVTWSSGDGQTVNCGAGTAFNENAMRNELATDSPTCGFRFQHTSASQPGGLDTVTATSHWVVNWAGAGTNGTIAEPDLTTSAQVRVGELQSVNTNLASIDGYGN